MIVKHSLYKKWTFPKGLIGDKTENEDAKVAALREVEEEGGVNAKILDEDPIIVQYNYRYKEFFIKKTVYYYLMEYISGNVKDHDLEVSDALFEDKKNILKLLGFKSDKEAFNKISMSVTFSVSSIVLIASNPGDVNIYCSKSANQSNKVEKNDKKVHFFFFAGIRSVCGERILDSIASLDNCLKASLIVLVLFSAEHSKYGYSISFAKTLASFSSIVRYSTSILFPIITQGILSVFESFKSLIHFSRRLNESLDSTL